MVIVVFQDVIVFCRIGVTALISPSASDYSWLWVSVANRRAEVLRFAACRRTRP